MPPQTLKIPGMNLGCGALRFRPGFYLIGENFDGRRGGPGPREVADVTGIAAGFRVRAACRHADTVIIAATDGTDTRIYQLDGTWKQLAAITSRVCRPNALISFKSVLAVGFDGANPYQFSTNTTTDGTAYTFTASTKTAANAKRAHVFVGQVNALTAPRVTYGVDPNEIYFTEDLTNGDATGSTASYIEDNSATLQYITNLVEDYTGEILICMRHDIYSLDSQGRVWRRTWENFPDGEPNAGGQSDRRNFECAAKVNGRIYFNYSGDEILEWHRGNINKYFAPKHLSGGMIPRMDLPINAMIGAHGYVVLALGTRNSGLQKSVTYAPGGSAHIGNTFNANGTSELYIGRYEEDTFVWHGVLLVCTDPLRFMHYDEDSGYIYLASGDSELVDAQQRRILFSTQQASSKISNDIPAYLGAGAAATGTGDVVPALPTGWVADDIFLLAVETANQVVSAPAGWTQVTNSPQGTGTAGGVGATRLTLLWRRAVTGDTAPTITAPGDHANAQIFGFRGCITAGNPWDVTSGNVEATSDTSLSVDGATTTVPNCLVVVLATTDTDTLVARWSGEANTDLLRLTERVDQSTDAGNGGGIGMWTGEKPTVGAYGATTATAADATVKGFMTVALRPPARDILLNSGTWKVDLGRIDLDEPFLIKNAQHFSMHTIGLGAPTLAVLYKLTSDYDNTAFATLRTFSSNGVAEVGIDFPPYPRSLFRTMSLELDGVGSGNTYAFFQEGELTVEPVGEQTVRRR